MFLLFTDHNIYKSLHLSKAQLTGKTISACLKQEIEWFDVLFVLLVPNESVLLVRAGLNSNFMLIDCWCTFYVYITKNKLWPLRRSIYLFLPWYIDSKRSQELCPFVLCLIILIFDITHRRALNAKYWKMFDLNGTSIIVIFCKKKHSRYIINITVFIIITFVICFKCNTTIHLSIQLIIINQELNIWNVETKYKIKRKEKNKAYKLEMKIVKQIDKIIIYYRSWSF